MTVRRPLHEHTCLICRGNFPCWKVQCNVPERLVCDDCAEQESEEDKQESATVC